MITGAPAPSEERSMLKLTFMMILGFVMVLLAFGYVNGGGNDKNDKKK